MDKEASTCNSITVSPIICDGIFHKVLTRECEKRKILKKRIQVLAVQGTLKSLLQHHSSKASIILCSAFFMVQLSHPYMTTGKTIALTIQTFVGKVMSLLFNMLLRFVIASPPRSKCLLIS